MKIALMVGCARSGTSILGELVGAHPDVKLVFEAHDVWELGGMGANESHRLTAGRATAPVVRRIRDWFEKQKGSAGLLVEKNPRNTLRIPYVRRIFPEAKLIHIVRDGRDVACSMVPGCGGVEWSHLRPRSWKTLMAQAKGPVRCALVWKEILEIALEDLEDVPHLQVRYEDLVGHPRQTADALLEFLELDSAPAVREFCGKIQNATAGAYHAQQQRQWYRDDHHRRVGRWRENLSAEEQRLINEQLGELLRRLGYE
jgi:hypothetical protein